MYTYTIEQIVYIMELHHNINLYNIIATQISSKLTYRHGNSMNINFLDSKQVNTIQDTKRETMSHQVHIFTKSLKTRT